LETKEAASWGGGFLAPGPSCECDKDNQHSRATTRWVWLFLITQQFSLLVPDLQAMPIDYVVIWTQRFGGFERQFK